MKADPRSLVSAIDSGGYVTITSKATGTAADYPNFSVSVSDSGSDPSLFSSPSFSASTSGPSLTGGSNAVYSTAGIFSETYTVDPWGNQQESGNFRFQQSYNPATNQINGYSYDAAGDLLGDGMNTYAYDGEGMLTSVNGAQQYVYDALQQRVEKTGGSNPTEVVYFNGHPIALLNPSTGAWTDLIWAGSNLLAEVAGNQTATPEYRLLDHEGSLVATTDGSGNVTGTNELSPYGETLSSNTSDPFSYAGLTQDTEYGGDAATFRNYSTEQLRWTRPDPYNGSYDLSNPQTMNRYVYAMNNPLNNIDPSGLDCVYDESGGTVAVVTGDCYSGTDTGYYIDGTINISAGITLNSDGSLTFGVTSPNGDYGVGAILGFADGNLDGSTAGYDGLVEGSGGVVSFSSSATNKQSQFTCKAGVLGTALMYGASSALGVGPPGSDPTGDAAGAVEHAARSPVIQVSAGVMAARIASTILTRAGAARVGVLIGDEFVPFAGEAGTVYVAYRAAKETSNYYNGAIDAGACN